MIENPAENSCLVTPWDKYQIRFCVVPGALAGIGGFLMGGGGEQEEQTANTELLIAVPHLPRTPSDGSPPSCVSTFQQSPQVLRSLRGSSLSAVK